MRPGIRFILRIHDTGRAILNAGRIAAAQVAFEQLFMRPDLYSSERTCLCAGQTVDTFLFVNYYGAGFRVLGHGLGHGAGFLTGSRLAMTADGGRE